jgi:hypothetical protein
MFSISLELVNQSHTTEAYFSFDLHHKIFLSSTATAFSFQYHQSHNNSNFVLKFKRTKNLFCDEVPF